MKRLLDACLEGQEENWSWEGIKGSPQVYGYRNKMEFTFGDEVKDGPLTLGMHKRGSFYDVVTVDGCRIVDEDYSLILNAVLTYFGSCPGGKPVRYYHRMRHEGYLRHLVVRKASRTGEILAALVTSSQNPWGEPEGCGEYGFEEGAERENALIEGFLQSLLTLKAYDHQLVDQSAGKIIETVKKTGAQVSGPVPLPTKKEVITILRAVHKYKDSREQFEQRTHKRLIDIITPSQKTVDALTRLEMPAGVYIDIKMKTK